MHRVYAELKRGTKTCIIKDAVLNGENVVVNEVFDTVKLTEKVVFTQFESAQETIKRRIEYGWVLI